MTSIFKKTDTYGDTINSYDWVKLIALLTMVIDHLGAYIWVDTDWLRVIGRMAFPLFLFLVGYSGNWKVKPDILLWGAVLIAFAALTFHPLFPFNILVTIAVVRWAMPFITRREMTPKYLGAIFISSIVWFPLFLWCDYSTEALLFAVCGYLHKQKPDARESKMFFYITLLFHFFLQWYSFQFSPLNALLLVPVTVLTGYIMQTFRLEKIACSHYPTQLRRALQWAARNTLPLYGLHILVLMCLEKALFPGRLLHFTWIQMV